MNDSRSEMGGKKGKQMNIRNMLVLGILAIICMTHAWAANPNLAGDSTDIDTITTVSTVSSVTSVANVAAGQVQTDAMSEGYVGSQSVTVGTATSAKIGTLTAGTKIVRITPAADVNYGGVWVGTGTGYAVMTATGAPYDFKVSTTTPSIYLMGNAASVAVLIEHIK